MRAVWDACVGGTGVLAARTPSLNNAFRSPTGCEATPECAQAHGPAHAEPLRLRYAGLWGGQVVQKRYPNMGSQPCEST